MLHHDPVCGKRINRNKAHIEIEYEGRDYLLCCPRCQAEFELDPARYVRKLGKKGGGSRRMKAS